MSKRKMVVGQIITKIIGVEEMLLSVESFLQGCGKPITDLDSLLSVGSFDFVDVSCETAFGTNDLIITERIFWRPKVGSAASGTDKLNLNG